MSSAKPFIADSTREKSLVLAYLRFPEITEVFQNIVNNRPLAEKVLSEWDPETLEGHIREFIVPQLLEARAIRKDLAKVSGYVSDFSELSFSGLSRSQLSIVVAKRALLISSTVENSDSREEVISANLHYHSLPDHLRSELINSLRGILNKYIQDIPDNSADGRQFRLALVARAEKAKE